jgi:hypothetical protein
MRDLAVRCLSIHAAYRCRDRGACCTAGWPIPVEVDRLSVMRGALASGQLELADGGLQFADAFRSPPDAPKDTPAVLAMDGHACVCYRVGRNGVRRPSALSRELGAHVIVLTAPRTAAPVATRPSARADR